MSTAPLPTVQMEQGRDTNKNPSQEEGGNADGKRV